MTLHPSWRRTTLNLHEHLTGRHILKRLNELNQTQWLSEDKLRALQQDRIQHLVNYAYQYVPYYQRTFQACGFEPGDLIHDFSCFSQLPILTKDLIREHFQEMVTTESIRKSQMSPLSTSGSTGQPLRFLQDPDFRDSVTADIQRHMGWAGWQLGDVQALVWGMSFHPDRWHKIRGQWVDWVWNRFQVNAFRLNDESMDAFARQIIRRRPPILFGYATSLHRFAQFIYRSAYHDITFNGIFSSAELLLLPVRQLIEETFHCKVFNRYGTLELGGVACECAVHDGMHTSAENNYVEILQNGRPCEPGEVGEITVTNLHNHGMPFIRYQIGDNGAWGSAERCACGRYSPRLQSVEGRTVDTFQTRDGHMAWAGFAGAAFRCLAHPTIRQFKVVQKAVDFMVVRLVREGEIPRMVLNEITTAIQLTFGSQVNVAFEFPDEIPALPSGKYRYAISEIGK